MNADTLEAHRLKLIARRNELDGLAQTGADAARPVELDQTAVGRVSRIDSIQQQAMAVANQRSRENERNRIDAALQRIARGDFGRCLSCDEVIAPARLAFDASIATCISCARQGG